MELDIAIVGGGPSGTYSAWRLQQEKGDQERIGLFEYSNRIGGRLFTVQLPGMPHVNAELGGMRYIEEDHIMVAQLINHLGLAKKNFPMGAPPPVGANKNLYYLRGKHFRLDQIEDESVVPYNLNWSERGLGPEALQEQVMERLHPGYGKLSLCDQMRVEFFGKPAWQYGFWDLMYRVLSNEGFQFMKDAGGYDANVANANAVTQLPATEYKDTTTFLTLRDGFDQLPKTLAQAFNDAPGDCTPAGERIHMNRRLAKIIIHPDQEYRYTLVFHPTETIGGKTSDKKDALPILVLAKKIILGMPRRSLERIESVFFDHPWLKKNIPSVLIQSAVKIFLAYEQPWWRALGLVAGRAVTDLPIRQLYYFGTECEQEDGYPFSNSLLMASYNDISSVPFWKGLEEGIPFEGHDPACLEPSPADHPRHQLPYPITQEMVDIAHRQVTEVHDQKEIASPYSAVYHDWAQEPFGGGWHEWKANYRIDEIMCRMRHPVEEEDIYITGSAYSYSQAWVEGALNTAESVLSEFFELDRPGWLRDFPDYEYMPVPCPGGCQDMANACIQCQPKST